ncbi:MAG: hypothetical protein EB070_01080 [Synechococcaceae bacterium WBA_2_066]|nr:hypothetical protein [Synechococcaceae bacterium WB6_1B_055]NBP99445.1 hypothetical protein [Synechococcaceae bacterium WB6_3A_227]NBR44838.1 hypothetical protein [Synechococcaceae bacterium WB5_2B_268]NCY13420.1 hypothetical protein [Synechococcaceae bacterium WB8_1A_041]NDC06211.1 hypothetical protein [Synechococcaceae bacterium WB9_2_069]NDE21990.1 hypothetical protein [Synechococcaceae bacterium WB9_3_282]NDE37128.1 hypothetical protein [Synechococcaceae bacterium WBA_2_066]
MGDRFFEYTHQKRPVCNAVTKVQSLWGTGVFAKQNNNKKLLFFGVDKHIQGVIAPLNHVINRCINCASLE